MTGHLLSCPGKLKTSSIVFQCAKVSLKQHVIVAHWQKSFWNQDKIPSKLFFHRLHFSHWLGVCLDSERCSLDTNSFANIKYEQTIQYIYSALSQLSSVHLPVWTCARLLTQKQMNQGNWICALSTKNWTILQTNGISQFLPDTFIHSKEKKHIPSLSLWKKLSLCCLLQFLDFLEKLAACHNRLLWVVFFNIFRDVSLFWFVYKVCNFCTFLSPLGDLGIGLVWDNHPDRTTPPQLFGPTVEILFKVN